MRTLPCAGLGAYLVAHSVGFADAPDIGCRFESMARLAKHNAILKAVVAAFLARPVVVELRADQGRFTALAIRQSVTHTDTLTAAVSALDSVTAGAPAELLPHDAYALNSTMLSA